MRSATRKRIGRDRAYLAWIHTQPCFCCELLKTLKVTDLDAIPLRFEAYNRIEAAHLGPRGLSQKAPDRMAVPLCSWHHREGPNSLHKLGVRFWERWPFTVESITRAIQDRHDFGA